MKLLMKLKDEDVGVTPQFGTLNKRSAVRAVLFKGDKIALLNVTRDKYHKLPGGGIEQKESIRRALFREILEETGCKIKILSEVGKISEHKTHLSEFQISYCYIAKVIREDKSRFTTEEKRAGFKLEWKSLDTSIRILKKEKPKNYEGKFIVKRDLEFIKTAKEIIRK